MNDSKSNSTQRQGHRIHKRTVAIHRHTIPIQPTEEKGVMPMDDKEAWNMLKKIYYENWEVMAKWVDSYCWVSYDGGWDPDPEVRLISLPKAPPEEDTKKKE